MSNFATRSIQSLKVRLNEFNRFINQVSVESIRAISYRDLKEFITQYRGPSIHIRKARIWSLRQFFHFLKLNGWVEANTALYFYPKETNDFLHGPYMMSSKRRQIDLILSNIFMPTYSAIMAATHLNKVSDPEITRHVLGHVRSNNTRK